MLDLYHTTHILIEISKQINNLFVGRLFFGFQTDVWVLRQFKVLLTCFLIP